MYRKYGEQKILRYCRHILEIVGEKAASCKSDLQEGLLAIRSRYWCNEIFGTLSIEITRLMYNWIAYYEYFDENEAFKEYQLNIIDEALKENDKEDFDISKSYKIIADNIDYIKDVLIKKIEED